MSEQARPLEGKILTPFVKVMVFLMLVGIAIIAARFVWGLGATTAMNDGYPWGLWIAMDVVVGTGLACGGYALALVVYILNRGKYHPMIRPALVASMLGYSAAGVGVIFDLGRWWNVWKVPVQFWHWNGNSVLLEVALCIMAYCVVLFLELAPAWLEGLAGSKNPGLAATAKAWLPRAEKVLPFLIALGLLLPTMHQSSLGSLMLISPTKLHGLWYTGLLPFFFLLTAFGMGYAIVVFESTFSAVGFSRPAETRMLATVGRIAAGVALAFVVVRFATVLLGGKAGLLFGAGRLSFMFWLEILLMVAGALVFLRKAAADRPDLQLQGAMLALLGAGLYRIDVFLVGYSPGPNWHYFPSVAEIFVTVGLLATEVVLYVVIVKRFPILAGAPHAKGREVPAGLNEGATT